MSDVNAQDVAWRKIRPAFSFQNLSVEAVAYVYENTFVSTETRKNYGTHATAHTIAEYIVQNLPIKENDHIFEPFAGHAPFLIAALQRMRSLLPLNISIEQRHDYFVRMLAGMEVDAFACEVARYSLILADYPNIPLNNGDICGVLAIGRCATCRRAFCRSHLARWEQTYVPCRSCQAATRSYEHGRVNMTSIVTCSTR